MSDWNTKIIEEFRANEGRVGGQFEGATLLLLHHTGAKSGVERVSPLAYFGQDQRMVIVASKGGAPENPAWFYNLKANPLTKIEVGTETVEVEAVELVGDDYTKTWDMIAAHAPGFAEYRDKTARQIPLLGLHRTAA